LESRTNPLATLRLAALVGAAAVLGGSAVPEQPAYLNQAIVELVPGADIELINAEFDTVLVACILEKNLYLLGLPNHLDPEQFAESLEQLEEIVVDAEVNDDAQSPDAVNGDTQPFFFSLHPGSYGQFENQFVSTLLNLPAAHGLTLGAGATVAVLDTGIDATHDLLIDQVLTGINYVDGGTDTDDTGNGIDDDGDGVVDEMVGHGTVVAGGIALVAPEASLLPVTVLDSDGNSDTFRILQGIYWALDHDADVINMSLSARTHNHFLRDAVEQARNAGVLVVAAAGNDDREHPVLMPAGDENGLGVASTDAEDHKSWFSNYGEHIDFSAPGDAVISSIPQNGYGEISGTSISTAIVSGVAALVKAQHPEATPDEIIERMANTAVPLDGLNPEYEGQLGAGRVDALAALDGQIGDLDRNGLVDQHDLAYMAEQWQTAGFAGDPHGNKSIGIVGYRHLLEVLRVWH
jgi:subtilisin family serine protease